MPTGKLRAARARYQSDRARRRCETRNCDGRPLPVRRAGHPGPSYISLAQLCAVDNGDARRPLDVTATQKAAKEFGHFGCARRYESQEQNAALRVVAVPRGELAEVTVERQQESAVGLPAQGETRPARQAPTPPPKTRRAPRHAGHEQFPTGCSRRQAAASGRAGMHR